MNPPPFWLNPPIKPLQNELRIYPIFEYHRGITHVRIFTCYISHLKSYIPWIKDDILGP